MPVLRSSRRTHSSDLHHTFEHTQLHSWPLLYNACVSPLFPCIVSDKPTLVLSICYLSVVYVVVEDMKRHRDAMTKLLHLNSLPCIDLAEFRNLCVSSGNPQLGDVWWVHASDEAEEANWKALPTYLNVPMELAMSCWFREKEKWDIKIAARNAQGHELTTVQQRLRKQWLDNDTRKLVGPSMVLELHMGDHVSPQRGGPNCASAKQTMTWHNWKTSLRQQKRSGANYDNCSQGLLDIACLCQKRKHLHFLQNLHHTCTSYGALRRETEQ